METKDPKDTTTKTFIIARRLALVLLIPMDLPLTPPIGLFYLWVVIRLVTAAYQIPQQNLPQLSSTLKRQSNQI